jgi:hypothetical protein
MSDEPNIVQNNEQILNDIQSLQKMEQQLFNNLETNTNLIPEKQKKIVEKMNQLSNMRINLYKTLNGTNQYFQNALSSSIGTLQEQTIAIGIVENELNRSKKRLEILEEEKNNKIRLVEINDYYSDKYAEHSQLMKIIIFTLVPIIILDILNNKGILPNSLYYFFIIIISIIGVFYFWRRFSSIIMRDNMNYQEYNWYFDPKKIVTSSTVVAKDPWLSVKTPGICVGQDCCSTGQTYDNTLNQCIGKSSVNESFLTETMINNILIKKQPGKYKEDLKLGDYKENTSKSFINNLKMF